LNTESTRFENSRRRSCSQRRNGLVCVEIVEGGEDA